MIRAVEAGDHQAWSKLWKAYLAFYGAELPDAVHASTWQRLLDSDEPCRGALALRDGTPVGLVHWIYHRTNWAIDDSCYLQDLFVDPAHRSTGLARALIAHVAEAAAARPCSRVYWLTHESNTTARALYDRVAQNSGFIQYRLPLPVR